MNSVSSRKIGPASPAFTLIEVLVVVAIIALLVAIMMPSLNQAKERAKVVQCLSNLNQLSKASNTYLSANRDRFCWAQIKNGNIYLASWYFGGNRGQSSERLGLGAGGYVEGNEWDWGPSERPLNRYVYGVSKFGDDHRALMAGGPLRVFECPSDKGGRWDGNTASKLHDTVTMYQECGTSYDENLQWYFYMDNEEAKSSNYDRGARFSQLLDRIIPIMNKKGPARSIILYEDPADWSLANGLLTGPGSFPKGFKVIGWHHKFDWHNVTFLDGHAGNLYIDWSKNLPDPPTRPNSGTGTWVAHQEIGDH